MFVQDWLIDYWLINLAYSLVQVIQYKVPKNNHLNRGIHCVTTKKANSHNMCEIIATHHNLPFCTYVIGKMWMGETVLTKRKVNCVEFLIENIVHHHMAMQTWTGLQL